MTFRMLAVIGSVLSMAVTAATRGAESTTVSIASLGASPDAKTLCTPAIEKAMDQLGDAGGVVEVPAGTFLTGPIHLRSNITLQLDEGAVLRFATDPALYPLAKTRYEGVEVMNYSALITAVGAHDVKITGKGTLDGQGSVWWHWARSTSGKKPAATQAATSEPATEAATEEADGNGPEEAPAPAIAATATLPGASSGQGVGGNAQARKLMLEYTADQAGKFPVAERVFGDKHPGFRPCFIEPWDCKGFTIEGVTVKQSPFWNIHPVYCEDVVVRNVTVYGTGPNTDGCDPDSCKNVLIEGCAFTTGDDCIAIKSGRDGDGLRVNKICENITVRNCVMTAGHGAISIGSETSGGCRHVLGENLKISGVDWGVRVKSARGRGGIDEDFVFRHLDIKNPKKGAITVDLRYGNPKDTSTAPRNETTPIIRDIHLEEVTCEGAPQTILVRGLPESHIEGLTMKNMTLNGKTGAALTFVDGFERENVTVTATRGIPWMLTEVSEKK